MGYRLLVAAAVLAVLLGDAGRRHVLTASPQSATAQDNPPQKASFDKLIGERDRWGREALRLRAEGRLGEAIAAAKRMLAIERQLLEAYRAAGRANAARQMELELVGSLQLIAELYERKESSEAKADFGAAEAMRKEALDRLMRLYPPNHPKHYRVIDARQALDLVRRLARLSREDRLQLRRTDQLNATVLKLWREGKARDALPLAQEAVKSRRRLLGESHPLYALSLFNLAALYHALGQMERAEALYREAMEIYKSVLAEAHPDYATCLNNLAALYVQAGDYKRAQPLLRQVVAIRKRILGEAHPAYATSLADLGQVSFRLGDYRTAERLFRDALRIRKQSLGENHPSYARSLGALALLYRTIGDYTRAEALYKQVLEVHKRAAGEETLAFITSLNNLADVYIARGEYPQARRLFERALELAEKVCGADDPLYVTAVNNLAVLYQKMGSYRRAETLFLRAIAIRKKILGEAHPDYATSLDNLAELYYKTGRYARAVSLFIQAMEIRKKVLGANHPAYGRSVGNLASFYQTIGDYARAERLFRESVRITRNVYGENHRNYAADLNNLALLYKTVGDYGRAEQLLSQARQILETRVGGEHPVYATVLNNLGSLYLDVGDYPQAELVLKQAVQIKKERLGEDHPDYATSLGNLANLYRATGAYGRAESLFRRVVEIYRNSLGERHPAYARGLNNLGDVYGAMGDYARAQAVLRQALDVTRRSLGEHHPYYVVTLNNIAVICNEMGDSARAESFLQQLLGVVRERFGEAHPHYAMGLNNLAVVYSGMGEWGRAESLYREAVEIIARNFGTKQPQYAVALQGLGWACAFEGRVHDGERFMREALATSEQLRDSVFAIQSRRQRLHWSAKSRGYLDGWLALADEAGVPARTVHSAVLRWKGAVLGRQREDHLARRHPELGALMEELNRVRTRWATLALAIPEPAKRAAWRRQLQELSDRKEDLESQLARRSAAFRAGKRLADLSSEALAEALPPGMVFVDFLVYTHPKLEDGTGGSEDRLLAFVLRRGQETVRLELGPVEPIGEAVERWRPSFGLDRDGARAAAELERRLLQPLRPYLAGAKLLIVAPDGPLCRFPLAALPGREPGSYLLEELRIGYVASGRHLGELLGVGGDSDEPRLVGRGLLVAGGIQYDAAPEEPAGAGGDSVRRPVAVEHLKRGGFAFLPGTLAEAEQVVRQYKAVVEGGRVVLLSGARARERRVKELLVRRWRYVHLATHGFFARPEELSERRFGAVQGAVHMEAAWERGDRLFSPLLLSGLVFAGATGGTGREEDGLFTAEEVAGLDLEGTELVVLSACDTGLGKLAGGEGVLGLQRAFHVAGARTVVSSLWRVDDAATSVLMEEFYRNLWQRSMGPLEALRAAQLFVLHNPDQVRQRTERFLTGLAERGIALQTAELPSGGRRSHPGVWAGFLLSGQWWRGPIDEGADEESGSGE